MSSDEARTRPPFKEEPSRQAGQSLRERIKTLEDQFAEQGILVGVSLGMTMYAWLIWFLPKYSPLIPTIILMCIYVWVAPKLIRARKELKNRRQGHKGEVIVGQKLDELRGKGVFVLHDVLFRNFNIDHVVVSKGGVFAIETKSWSKPMRGSTEIFQEEKSLRKPSGFVDVETIPQAEFQAKRLRKLIKELTGMTPDVMPVVVIPGWCIKTKAGSSPPLVPVLHESYLASHLLHQPERLEEGDVRRIYERLSENQRDFAPVDP